MGTKLLVLLFGRGFHELVIQKFYKILKLEVS